MDVHKVSSLIINIIKLGFQLPETGKMDRIEHRTFSKRRDLLRSLYTEIFGYSSLMSYISQVKQWKKERNHISTQLTIDSKNRMMFTSKPNRIFTFSIENGDQNNVLYCPINAFNMDLYFLGLIFLSNLNQILFLSEYKITHEPSKTLINHSQYPSIVAELETQMLLTFLSVNEKHMLDMVTKGHISEEVLFEIGLLRNWSHLLINNHIGQGHEWLQYHSFRQWALDTGYQHGCRLIRNMDQHPNSDYAWANDSTSHKKLGWSQKDLLLLIRSRRILTINRESKSISEWSDQSGVPVKIIESRLKKGWAPDNLLLPAKNRMRRGIKELTIRGETKTIHEWARAIGIKPQTLLLRIKNGWTEEELLAPPITKETRLTIEGQNKTIREWAEMVAISPELIRSRIRRGISGIELLSPPKHSRKKARIPLSGAKPSSQDGSQDGTSYLH